MSWFPEKRRSKTWLQRACEAVLCSGPVPRHIAFIMDGNRRFASRNSLAKQEGHIKGFDKLAETLEWCLDLGITEVTVYAFSIENFKRSPDEVNGLMELARQKFARLLKEKELISRHGVCVRVLGDVSLLPGDLQALLAEAVHVSRENTRAILNVCFSYTARDDMCAAMREMAAGVKEGSIRHSDMSEDMLEQCLRTSHCSHVDLLIRTSGEVRLSDFLMWESAFSCLSFMKVLWPDFSIWHLYAGVLHYQRSHHRIQMARQNNAMERQRLLNESDLQCVMSDSRLGSEVTELSGSHGSTQSLKTQVQQYREEREKRVSAFLQQVHSRRRRQWEALVPRRGELGPRGDDMGPHAGPPGLCAGPVS